MTPLLPLALILSIHPATITPTHHPTKEPTMAQPTAPGGGANNLNKRTTRYPTNRPIILQNPIVNRGSGGYPGARGNPIARMAPTTTVEHTNRPGNLR